MPGAALADALVPWSYPLTLATFATLPLALPVQS
jgi:hypothetical protein